MYWFLYRLRFLVILLLVGGVIAGVAYVISVNDREVKIGIYNRSVTAAVETAIARTLIGATRTAEAPNLVYQLVQLGQGEALLDVAERYGTSLEALRMVNGLAPDVMVGNGERIVVPVNMLEIIPPRQIVVHTVRLGDTLEVLALENGLPLSFLEDENPVLVGRALIPGDIVFIPKLL